MKLDSDDFELFGVPRRFKQDPALLDQHWRALQARVHPDRFVTEGAPAQRRAMQWAVRVNEAHQRLKNPLTRAAYLCELAGCSVQAENNTAMAPEFLMQQMAWREALDEAHGLPDVQALQAQVLAQRHASLHEIEFLLDQAHQPAAAAQQVRALMFIERFLQDVDQRLDRLQA